MTGTPRTIYLARHGETEWNRQLRWQGHSDIALNDLGRAQAAGLADRLRSAGVGRVHASDLGRARETAEIAAGALGAAFGGVDARLRERRYGLFEGLTREECEAQHPLHWRRYVADQEDMPPGAESRPDVTRRMLEAVHDLARGADGAPILAVSHGSAIRSLVLIVSGSPGPPLANASVVRILVRPDGREARDPLELASRFAIAL